MKRPWSGFSRHGNRGVWRRPDTPDRHVVILWSSDWSWRWGVVGVGLHVSFRAKLYMFLFYIKTPGKVWVTLSHHVRFFYRGWFIIGLSKALIPLLEWYENVVLHVHSLSGKGVCQKVFIKTDIGQHFPTQVHMVTLVGVSEESQ